MKFGIKTTIAIVITGLISLASTVSFFLAIWSMDNGLQLRWACTGFVLLILTLISGGMASEIHNYEVRYNMTKQD